MTTLPDWGDSGRGTLDGASADAAAEGPEAAATLEGLRVSFALGPSLLRQQQAAASATVPTANELLLGTDLTDARIPERLKARWTKTQGVPRALPKCCGPQRGKTPPRGVAPRQVLFGVVLWTHHVVQARCGRGCRGPSDA